VADATGARCRWTPMRSPGRRNARNWRPVGQEADARGPAVDEDHRAGNRPSLHHEVASGADLTAANERAQEDASVVLVQRRERDEAVEGGGDERRGRRVRHDPHARCPPRSAPIASTARAGAKGLVIRGAWRWWSGNAQPS